MINTPSSLRLQIGIFGRTNVGKSTVLNLILGQYAAITSSGAGTTTDVVKRSMELLPVGPVLFLDTAGLGDGSELSFERERKTWIALRRCDVAMVIIESGVWTEFEDDLIRRISKARCKPVLIINKIDIRKPDKDYIDKIKSFSDDVIQCNAASPESRDGFLHQFKNFLLANMPSEFLAPIPMLGDLVPTGGHVVLIIPIDIQAPKGRIILPQVQAIRDSLDHNCIVTIVKESEYRDFLKLLNKKPDLVVCDSQVVDKMVSWTPENIACTTFSILASRLKGNLISSVMGINTVECLKPESRILIAESCTHHPLEADIGRVQIPRLLENYLGFLPHIDVVSGKDFPENLNSYDLVIHCGACMINRREMVSRVQQCIDVNVPITNYGVCISYLRKTLKRVIKIFPKVMYRYYTNVVVTSSSKEKINVESIRMD